MREAVAADQPETAVEMLAYIRELQVRDGVGSTRDERVADLFRTQETIVATADRIMETDAADDVLVQAAQAKMSALSNLAQLGARDTQQRIAEFCRGRQVSAA